MRIPIFDINDNIDEKTCLTIYDNSYDFYEAVLRSFVKQGKQEIEKLKSYMLSGDRENYRILIHGLKSAAGSVGAKNLQMLAAMMDQAYKKGDWDSVEENHLRLVADYDNLLNLIEERLERS